MDQNYILEYEIMDQEKTIKNLEIKLSEIKNQESKKIETKRKIINSHKVVEIKEKNDSSDKESQEIIDITADTLQNQ
jgi:hypothetical protein